ncbi:MAG TPA: hypothetical protein VHY35_02900 [Stellaceae bacterium]|jgi:uncharacterized protein YlbG (UPF0298 family)|nr:hypothetical protein [Stellaceae bacterium]
MVSATTGISVSQIGSRVFRQRRIVDGLKRARKFRLLPAAEQELDALLTQLKASHTVRDIEVSP